MRVYRKRHSPFQYTPWRIKSTTSAMGTIMGRLHLKEGMAHEHAVGYEFSTEYEFWGEEAEL